MVPVLSFGACASIFTSAPQSLCTVPAVRSAVRSGANMTGAFGLGRFGLRQRGYAPHQDIMAVLDQANKGMPGDLLANLIEFCSIRRVQVDGPHRPVRLVTASGAKLKLH